MAGLPKIVRAVPHRPITRPEIGVPVVATSHWQGGEQTRLPATVTAWTQNAVEVTWAPPRGELRSDWIPAEHVRRGEVD